MFVAWPGARINPKWLQLPISRPNFNGSKDVRAIEVSLYTNGSKLFPFLLEA